MNAIFLLSNGCKYFVQNHENKIYFLFFCDFTFSHIRYLNRVGVITVLLASSRDKNAKKLRTTALASVSIPAL